MNTLGLHRVTSVKITGPKNIGNDFETFDIEVTSRDFSGKDTRFEVTLYSNDKTFDFNMETTTNKEAEDDG